MRISKENVFIVFLAVSSLKWYIICYNTHNIKCEMKEFILTTLVFVFNDYQLILHCW